METIDENIAYKHFEDLYILLRDGEGRLYTDEEVKKLPDVAPDHIYKQEWAIRKASSERLLQYLKKKNKLLKMLEVGCGNGWLSHKLSTIEGSIVTGVDINKIELDQASRVFSDIKNLSFVYGDINSEMLKEERFDIIVFAASIQYFQSLRGIINIAFDLLNTEGEIHILDTHFYPAAEVKSARERSEEHFKKMGYQNMSKFYFHHSREELQTFDHQILSDAGSFINRFFYKNPFSWFCIKATT